MKNWFSLLVLLLLLGCATATSKRSLQRRLPPPPGDVTLLISLTNLVNQCMVSWVAGPPTMDGQVVAGGGSGTVVITNYTGPGVVLTAVGLLTNTNGCFIETSTNLTNWLPFPTNGFQLALIVTNSATCLAADQLMMFYRGRIGPINQ